MCPFNPFTFAPKGVSGRGEGTLYEILRGLRGNAVSGDPAASVSSRLSCASLEELLVTAGNCNGDPSLEVRD